MCDHLLFGDKKVPIPKIINKIEHVRRKNFGIRSRQKLAQLELLFCINWHTFLKVSMHYRELSRQKRYIAYGSIGNKNITYDMYKHSGENIGDVFIRFGNGKRVLCGVETGSDCL